MRCDLGQTARPKGAHKGDPRNQIRQVMLCEEGGFELGLEIRYMTAETDSNQGRQQE